MLEFIVLLEAFTIKTIVALQKSPLLNMDNDVSLSDDLDILIITSQQTTPIPASQADLPNDSFTSVMDIEIPSHDQHQSSFSSDSTTMFIESPKGLTKSQKKNFISKSQKKCTSHIYNL